MFDYTLSEYIYLTIGTVKGLWYQSFGISFNNPIYLYSGISLILLINKRIYNIIKVN